MGIGRLQVNALNRNQWMDTKLTLTPNSWATTLRKWSRWPPLFLSYLLPTTADHWSGHAQILPRPIDTGHEHAQKWTRMCGGSCCLCGEKVIFWIILRTKSIEQKEPVVIELRMVCQLLPRYVISRINCQRPSGSRDQINYMARGQFGSLWVT